MAPGEHPFDLLPERDLGEPVAVVDPELDFGLLRIPRLAQVSDDSFVAPIRLADGSVGVAHAGLDGEIRSWVLEEEDFQRLANADLERGNAGQMTLMGLGLLGDTVWLESRSLYDVTIHRWSLEGEELGEERGTMESLQLVRERMGAPASGLLVDGRAWLDLHNFRHTLWNPRQVVVDAGLLVRSVHDADSPIDTLVYSDDVQVGVGPVRFEPFGHPPLLDVTRTGDRIVIVEWEADRPADLHLRTLDLSEGGHSLDTTLALPPLELDEEVVEEALQAAEDAMVQGMVRNLVPNRETILDSIRTPEFRPVARRVMAGADGSVWLLRDDPSASVVHGASYVPEAQRWAVLDPAGEPSFQVVLPGDEYPVLARMDQLWTSRWSDGRLSVWSLSDDAGGGGP